MAARAGVEICGQASIVAHREYSHDETIVQLVRIAWAIGQEQQGMLPSSAQRPAPKVDARVVCVEALVRAALQHGSTRRRRNLRPSLDSCSP